MAERTFHIPVMVDETLRYVLHGNLRVLLDGTVGFGGHARAILESASGVSVIGVDKDTEALDGAAKVLGRFGARVKLVNASYADVDRYLGDVRVDGVLLDLGVSSLQLDKEARGFAHSLEGPLDMRMGGKTSTARDYLQHASEEELADAMREYGEVSRPRDIVRSIRAAAANGKMDTTGDLRAAVASAVGGTASPKLLSKVFQAIRIVVNNELAELRAFLERILDHANPEARIVIISYHSLEDRIVKQFFRAESRDCVCPPRVPVCACEHEARLRPLTKRVLKPSQREIAGNPRARSARLRAAAVLN